MTRVYLCQCLCPKRHTTLAVGIELPETAAEEEIKKLPLVLKLIVKGTIEDQSKDMLHINPWCALCRAPESTWIYEAAPTRWRTMAEAKPHLEAVERSNLASRAAILNAQHKAEAN